MAIKGDTITITQKGDENSITNYYSYKFADVHTAKDSSGSFHIEARPTFPEPMVDDSPIVSYTATFDMQF